ncbi:phosphoglycerate dehydrogenase-like enzyme [Aequitasia blattaphilus]|nr:NAD(P)-dependent oxidoreductase [Aequitasia blattaphilus]
MIFKKIVAIEPTKLLPEWNEKLRVYGEECVFYDDIPSHDKEIISRIGDADCVLLSYTSGINSNVMKSCPNIKYIGMCCSLYAPENANVDILWAQAHSITVTGVRDYGDDGVREYVVSELVRLLHNRPEALELTDLNIGILGLGTLGTLIAKTLRFFGANIYYYSRTRKEDVEQDLSIHYLPLANILPQVDILITCLNKNVVLLGEDEFRLFGNDKILMNVSISPSHEIPALKNWLSYSGNLALSDTPAGIGEEISDLKNVICGNRSAGLTSLAKVRLAQKVIRNIESYLS